MANDTNIWLWEYYGANTQKWKLNPVNVKEGQEIADGTYTIGLASNNNYVFDVSYCSSKNGTKIQLMNRNGNIAQLFRIKYEGNGEYTINTGASLYNSSVDILGGNTTNATINQWANNGLAPQRWKITKSGNGYVFRSVINENLVLDASGASNGASLTLATYNANDNTQKFTLTKGSGWLISGDRKYYFNENGNKPEVGIDVSYHNGTIDWQKVKAAGVEYAIIRCGYRGASTGALVEDPYFEKNIKNATEAGVRVGVYFFTQATTPVEAVEEASMVLMLCNQYKISFPLYIDTEGAGGNGRADGLDVETRTAVCTAFCETIENAGYTAGVYASKNWLTGKLDAQKLSPYSVWLAQYSGKPSYQGTYDMWQYTSAGTVDGISTLVDFNVSYMDY